MKKFLIILFASVSLLSANAQKKAFTVSIYGNGQPVILIPGYSCSGDVWKETVQHLSGRYQCHVL